VLDLPWPTNLGTDTASSPCHPQSYPWWTAPRLDSAGGSKGHDFVRDLKQQKGWRQTGQTQFVSMVLTKFVILDGAGSALRNRLADWSETSDQEQGDWSRDLTWHSFDLQ
jgi:hypothetical protein